MGIPSFFRKIIKEYPETHFWRNDVHVDSLYFDFNCLIYHCLNVMDKQGLTPMQIEKELIAGLIRYTAHIICDVVKPNKLVYIAVDGPAPRAKMVQQRARRFKRKIDQLFKQYLKDKYDLPNDNNDWDSRKISPGTIFMEKMIKEMKKAISAGAFSNYQNETGEIEIIVSDCHTPGEGEHKIIPLIRDMRDDTEQSVCIYGLDADLIVLAMGTGKNKILILREPKDSEIEKAVYKDCEFLYLSIDVIRQSFLDDLSKTIPIDNIDVNRIFSDYVLLTFLGGNDFVRPISFLHIKEGGLRIMLDIYKQLLNKHDDYLVIFDKGKPNINLDFFKELIDALCRQEVRRMKRRQFEINKKRQQQFDNIRAEREQGLTPFQLEYTRFQHLPFYIKDHPLHQLYNPIIERIDYAKPIKIWREKYYQHFFGLDPKNDRDTYNKTRRQVSINYLKSLCFTLEYYLHGTGAAPPSWTWYYQYRVAPLISDIQFVLNRFKEVNFRFNLGRPYRPFQQLMMIMPADGSKHLSRECSKLMTDQRLKKFYPEEIELDVAAGLKYIYSEPILEQINDKTLFQKMKGIHFTANEKLRNRLVKTPFKVVLTTNS